ncbi:homoserine dehydrogenase [Anaerobacillus alkalidiazotrophicus]|uniref:Homoserine dehydrogenase n=1 Tax=Anaerobacillus alkalidiazotrophicus TaxID=472963 RepID=A0A1S2M4N2_9BACI|nr:homoserine dehydrogenase [Anaerobacillus alkalidiazotrophicus]OIJ18827.1 homoserine dehydrogenase [Anaerobacillus alkalidiazotrophicus]
MSEKISIGLLGFGTVGSGVVRIVENHQQELKHQVGSSVVVDKILVKDAKKPRAIEIDERVLTEDPEDIISNPNIDVVVEVMGGIEEARDYIIRSLENKKHVVTANKDLMAMYGAELLTVASKNGCDLFYEASVAGGIPIIRSLVEGLSSDRITKMMGIVNGTTNYILTKMSNEGSSYNDVLKEAQELGYAESDPTADVEGLDAARKMAILGTLGFSMNIGLDDVSAQGISAVTEEDLDYAKQLGYRMKLVGVAKRDEGKVEVSVQPTLLPKNHPLASVNDVFNAVYVYGEAVGETMFYGPGAGSLPTATAVVSDLITVMKNMRLGVNGRSALPPLHEKQMKTDEDVISKYFMRLHVEDKAGAFAAITTLFSENNVSFEKLLQMPIKNKDVAEVVIITHKTNKKTYELISSCLTDLEVVKEVKSSYRIEGVSYDE